MAIRNDLYINVEPYTEILGGLSFVLSISNGVVKLTGKTGAGKTALCIELLRELKSEKIEFVHFPDAPENFDVVVQTIKDKLKLAPKTTTDKESFIQSLTAHIIKKSFDEQRLVLIFDDAENLSSDLLAELTAFRHIHLNDQGLISMVLSGTEDMDKKLNHAASSLVSDLLVSYTLEPMNREQLAEFCSAYLAEIKMDATLTDGNISQLLEISQGLPGEIPEMIPEILDQDSSKLYSRKKRQKEFVNKASKTLAHEFVDPFADKETQEQVVKRWKWPVGPSVIVAGLAVGMFFVYAAYVFIPEGIIPSTVSYFGAEFEDVVDVIIDEESPVEPVVETPIPTDEVLVEETPVIADIEPAETENIALAENTEAELPLTEEPEQDLVQAESTLEPEEVAEQEIENTAPVVEEVVQVPQIEEPPVVTEAVQPATRPAPQITANDEVETAIQAWLQAWSNQDLNNYFDSYHEAFEPPSFSSIATWRNQRERNILRPASIEITYEDYMVQSRNDDSTMLRLSIEYRSPTYADRTLKQLGLIKDAEGQWKIVFEDNIQVERLPVNRVAAAPAEDRLQVYLSPQISSSTSVPVLNLAPGVGQQNLNAEQEQFFDFVNNWLLAWQKQDVSTYFSFYRADYRGFNFTSPNAWEQDRMVKISRPSYIELRMSDFEVLMETSQDTLVQFNLEYRSSYYADRTLKQVLLSKDASGSLQITNELNRQVELLPIYRRVNSALALF